VVKDFLAPGKTYALADFVERSRTALSIASQRVEENNGFACPRARPSSPASRLPPARSVMFLTRA
jgi:uncharacterized repeat protein (TIGR04042 family)